ncbi:MAG TPA: PTS sugar transporter subunit IIA [Stellaceae bacterium]|nr:PTS sugar transporter subunit IIA [Stellaceae bacterium]
MASLATEEARWRETAKRISPLAIVDLITRQSVIARLRVSTKADALAELAKKSAELIRAPDRPILDALLARERLGSTGIGGGVAVPHAKLPGLMTPVGVFARLEKPIDFQSVDGRPVDLVFTVLTPEFCGGEHLKALAAVSRVLRDPEMSGKLRRADDEQALYVLLAHRISRGLSLTI